jgi:hypothetical protein
MIEKFLHLRQPLMCILMCSAFSAALNGQHHMPFTSNRSLSWEESIAFYSQLDRQSEYARLLTIGSTDVGKPLHLFVLDKEQRFEPELLNRKKTIVLINNSIHPGEPDGADACAWLCSEMLEPSNPLHALLDSVILCIIPVYNVDGALRRNSTSRANQEGPEAYGFRGNARNLDLNRDFVKCDSENARSFSRLFTRLKPHVFVDTHVSNGADYPYTMTLITTQVHKLGGAAGEYLRGVMEPATVPHDGRKRRTDVAIRAHDGTHPGIRTRGLSRYSAILDGLCGAVQHTRLCDRNTYAQALSTTGESDLSLPHFIARSLQPVLS